jgi:hypothetical protein
MIHDLSMATSGAVFFGCIAVGMFFLRFWRQTRVRFFCYFAIAFFILALARVILLALVVDSIHQPLIYCTRLVAFLVIAWAIWDANRARR